MEEREEPHPGQRLSSSTTTVSPCAADHACAAREAWSEPSEVAGKSAPRTSGAMSLLPKSQHLPRRWLRPTPAKYTFNYCCQVSTSTFDTSQAPPAAVLPMMGHTHSVDCLPASTTPINPTANDTETTASSELSSPQPTTAGSLREHDIPLYLEPEVDDEKASMASLECGQVTASGEDPYGWEAGLKRRESCSIAGLRQGKDWKRKSLRRWLNLGFRHAPSRHHYNPALALLSFPWGLRHEPEWCTTTERGYELNRARNSVPKDTVEDQQ